MDVVRENMQSVGVLDGNEEDWIAVLAPRKSRQSSFSKMFHLEIKCILLHPSKYTS